MHFRTWLEKTLYHGTIVDYEDDIRRYGLQGGWHEPENTWVGDAYDGEYGDIERTEDDDVIFMADKHDLDKSLGAMVFHIGKKLGKGFHDVTDNDIRNHGLLVIIRDPDDETPQYDPDDRNWGYGDPPRGAETGDYFAPSAEGEVFLRGAALLRFLRQRGVWPRSWGPHDPNRDRLRRGLLGRMAVQRVTDKPKQDIIDTVKVASPKDVEDQLRSWDR